MGRKEANNTGDRKLALEVKPTKKEKFGKKNSKRKKKLQIIYEKHR